MMESNKLVIILYCVGFCITWCNAATLYSNEPCVPIEKCSHLSQLISTKPFHYGSMNVLNILHCYHINRRAHVRCVSKEKVENYMKKIELLPGPDICGPDIPQTKITNGEICELDEFPWIALLRYLTIENKLQYGCHATLINKHYVVTAAHCVNPEDTKQKIGELHSVVLGEYDVSTKTDCVASAIGSPDCAEEAKEYMIDYYHLHPKYDHLKRVNDIALIRLKGEVKFSEFIKPICLPKFLDNESKNETWWIGGWGPSENQTMNNIKVKAQFAPLEKDQCRTTVTLTPTHLCAGSTNISKTCPGDSGGPLMFKLITKDDTRVYLIGINSLGISDCSKNIRLSIFTRTSPYIDWIIDTIQE